MKDPLPLLAHQISIYQHYPIEFWLLLSFVFLHQISLFHHHKGKLLFVCRVHFLDVLQSIMLLAFTFLFVVLYPADTTIHFYHLVFPCISTCIIYYFSPVSATNKPLDDLEALHYKKMARKILFSEILFFLLILLIFNTQITFAFFFSFTIHLSVLALQITVELVSKNFFANL